MITEGGDGALAYKEPDNTPVFDPDDIISTPGTIDIEQIEDDLEFDMSSLENYCCSFPKFIEQGEFDKANVILHALTVFFLERAEVLKTFDLPSLFWDLFTSSNLLIVLEKVIVSVESAVIEKSLEFIAVLSSIPPFCSRLLCFDIKEMFVPLFGPSENAVRIVVNCLSSLLTCGIDVSDFMDELIAAACGAEARNSLLVGIAFALSQKPELFLPKFGYIFGMTVDAFSSETAVDVLSVLIRIFSAAPELINEFMGTPIIGEMFSRQGEIADMETGFLKLGNLLCVLIGYDRRFIQSVNWSVFISPLTSKNIKYSIMSCKLITAGCPEMMMYIPNPQELVKLSVSMLITGRYEQKIPFMRLLTAMVANSRMPGLSLHLEKIEFVNAITDILLSDDSFQHESAIELLNALVECSRHHPTAFNALFVELLKDGVYEILLEMDNTSNILQALQLLVNDDDDPEM